MPKVAASDAESRRLRFTQLAVDRMNVPVEGRIEVWDTVLPGFGLRLASSGRKSWQVLYRVKGRPVRETLGTTATMPKVDDARSAARASLARAAAGGDPVAERNQAARRTLDAVLDRYLAGYAARRMRPNYLKETARTFAVDVRPALGLKPINEVTRRDVRELLEGIVERGSPSHANHVLAYLRAAMNWAVAEDLIEVSPCTGIKNPAPNGQRDRALNDDEIRLFWLACDRLRGAFAPFFRMMLLTGQRPGEVAGMVWDEIDADVALWHLPGARTKNKQAHDVALAPAALAILEAQPRYPSGLVFTATGKPLKGFDSARNRLVRIMREITGQPVQHFTPHDLRRTAASGMARIGIAPHVVDRILNHLTGKISGVAAIYNRYEYTEERAVALVRWAAHIEGLVKPRASAM